MNLKTTEEWAYLEALEKLARAARASAEAWRRHGLAPARSTMEQMADLVDAVNAAYDAMDAAPAEVA